MTVDADRAVIVPVPIAHLLTLLPIHPYATPAWGCDPFTVADVHACTDREPADFDTWPDAPRSRHIAHIAYLAEAWPNDGTASPEVHVHQGVTLVDGWHRLAAAMARSDEHLYVDLSGDLGEALALGIPFGRPAS